MAPKIQTHMPQPSDSPDSGMADSPLSAVAIHDNAEESDDSPENKILKRAERGRTRKPLQEGRLAVPTEPIEHAEDILENGVTVLPIS
jgi:hypothetical protein